MNFLCKIGLHRWRKVKHCYGEDMPPRRVCRHCQRQQEFVYNYYQPPQRQRFGWVDIYREPR